MHHDYRPQITQIFTDLYSQTGRLLCIMNYALWIIVAHRLHRFSLIFAQARKHIITLSSHLSVLSCDIAHRFPQIFTDLYSQNGRLLCIMIIAHRLHRFSLIYNLKPAGYYALWIMHYELLLPTGGSRAAVPSSRFKVCPQISTDFKDFCFLKPTGNYASWLSPTDYTDFHWLFLTGRQFSILNPHFSIYSMIACH